MKKQSKKLVLSRETLKQLTSKEDLEAVAGGATVICTEFCNSGSLCHC